MISRPDFEKKQLLFVFSTQGEKLSFSNDNIVVKDKDGKIKHQSTCYRLFMVFVIGETSITSGLIQRAKKFGFSICLMNRSMRVYQILIASMEGNTQLRRRQYGYEGLDQARHIIKNKLINQRLALQSTRNRDEGTKEAVEKIREYCKRIDDGPLSLQELLGLEGLSARIYFREMFSKYEWKGRKPRIKQDYINSTLDIGYTILFELVDALLNAFGFDTYVGVLHQQFFMRKSLVCDIVEPFRPVIDLQIRKSLNYGQIKEKDFERFGERVVLKWKESPRYTAILAESLLDRKQDIFDYIQGYYRSVMKGREAKDFPMFMIGG